MNNLNAASLIRAGRSIQTPFQLLVSRADGDSSQLTIRQILRLLPGRRIVAVAEEDGQELLVKIFVGRFASRYSGREVRGVKALESAGVRTPGLVWQGELFEGGGRVVAFDYIEQASDLIDVWDEGDSETRKAILERVILELARLHSAGVVQNDIHPENFLIQGREVFTIDGGDVRKHRDHRERGLIERVSIDNLALFLAQFHSRNDGLIPAALSCYEKERGWEPCDARSVLLVNRVLKLRAERKEDYISKAFRECTRFVCRRSFRRFSVCERRYDSPAMRKLLADLDNAIEAGTLLKAGNTATVALVEGPETRLVVKRYNIKNGKHLLERMFRKSRAWTSWANTMRLEFLGIRTLKPVAMLEERIGPLRGRAYFISEYVEGEEATGLGHQSEPEAEIASMVKIIQSMAAAGLSHGDLKASNFLLTEDGVVIIDLDSMRELSDEALKVKAASKDRDRFLRNWSANPQLEQRFRELLD